MKRASQHDSFRYYDIVLKQSSFFFIEPYIRSSSSSSSKSGTSCGGWFGVWHNSGTKVSPVQSNYAICK